MESDGLPGRPVTPVADGILTVQQVTVYLKRLLDRDELLQDVIVRGEISNFVRASSGHLYFSLKDEASQLSTVCFRGAAIGLKFDPKDGDRVIAGGGITVYERGGKYQLIAKFMRPDGVGDLAAALELLRAKLEAEGLFDPSRKRPLPRFPDTIAICTSPTGAAVKDLTSIIARRYPLARMIVIPTVVQGDEAAPSIVRALQIANGLPDVDVIIFGRGGGSIEDLWAFNEEPVVRAIFASRKPTISAVGHETDFTLSDFVADVRAATPSMAAEMAVPDSAELAAALSATGRQLRSALAARLGLAQSRLERATSHPALRRPQLVIEQRQLLVDDAAQGLDRNLRTRLERLHARVDRSAATLDALSPVAVVNRGYAICRHRDGRILRRISEAAFGDEIEVTVRDGHIDARTLATRPLAQAQPPEGV